TGGRGRLDDVGQPAVAPCEDAFQPGELAVVPAEFHAAPAELAAEQRLPRLRLLDVELGRPLERRVRLRRERGDAGRHPEPPPRRAPHPSRPLRAPEHVLLRLAWEGAHAVKLEAPPSEV